MDFVALVSGGWAQGILAMSFHTDLILVPALLFIGVCVQVPFKRVRVFLAKVRAHGFVGVLGNDEDACLVSGSARGVDEEKFQVVGSDNRAS